MSSIDYKVLGRAGAGSLIAEFLFREIGVNYEITFVDPKNYKPDDLRSTHPQEKIPMLVCPDHSLIFETLAIVNHITDRYNKLVPERRTSLYDRYWQFLSLMATSIYPAYHRQHHSQHYVEEEFYSELRLKAQKEQSAIYDYIERELDPYICKDFLSAADFYLYMLLRWDLHKDTLYQDRPKLKAFAHMMRNRPSVVTVLDNQPKLKR